MELDDVKRIAVIGLGRMGHGIAQAFAMGGYEVCGFDMSAEARASANDRISNNLKQFVANDLLSAAEAASVQSRVSVAETEHDAVQGAQFVVEAIAEKLEVKQSFFERIEQSVSPQTILASNSSTFTVTQSCTGMQHPERAVVTHWFNPPHIVPTVEVVPGPNTTEVVTDTTIGLHRKIGKLAVRVRGEIPGFLVNRIQIAMIREVWDMYERGIASPEDIDAAIQGSVGFRLAVCGPLSICDFGGVDIWSTVYGGLAPDLRSDSEIPKAVQQLVAEGRLGTRTGQGLRDYPDGQIDEMTAERDQAMLQLAKLFHSPQRTNPNEE